MILTEKMLDALEILKTGTASQSKITDPDLRVIQHVTMTRLALHHLAEPADGAKDRFDRPLWRITKDGTAVLEAARSMPTTPTPEGQTTS